MSDKQLTIKRWAVNPASFNLEGRDGRNAVVVERRALGFDLDPEALRDWIEEQRPRPRYGVERAGAGTWPWDWAVYDTVDGRLAIARFRCEDNAQEYADICNEAHEREATK